MGGTAFDTSVIVAALLTWHDHHQAAQTCLNDALESEAKPILPLPAIMEAYSIMTRLPPQFRVSAFAANHLLDQLRPQVQVVALEGAEVWTLINQLTIAGVIGGAAHDAHIVACVRKTDAKQLATFNVKDFARLDLGNLEIKVP